MFGRSCGEREGDKREREREQAGERVGKLEEKEGNDGRTAEEGRKHQHYEEEEKEDKGRWREAQPRKIDGRMDTSERVSE